MENNLQKQGHDEQNQAQIRSGQTQSFFLVDDHAAVLNGTAMSLKQEFPNADIATAMTAQEARQKLKTLQPDVVIVDLSLPEATGETCRTETGIGLLREFLETYIDYNFVVQSANVASLVRIKPTIDAHQGGFALVDKGEPIAEMLKRVSWAMDGLVYTPPTMRKHLEIKSEWMQVLELAVYEGLNDKTIAKRMNVAERTVRNYWAKLQDVLGVYHEEGKILRIQTELRAREEGLID
ncbi:MAG: response regulator transcription factor [Cyanobacteria bacterium P01_D01_bin.36]